MALPDELVDSVHLQALSEQYGDLIGELIEIFAQTTPAVLSDLSAAHERDDPAAIRQSAHSLKGACRNVGATFMAGRCRALETDPSAAGSELARLTDAFEPTLARLRSTVA